MTGVKLSAAVLWFFPVSLALHIAEEFWAGEGFLAWNFRVTGTAFSAEKFFVLLTFGVVLVLVGIFLVRKYARMRWIVSALATIYFINGISHLVSTIVHQRYSPGLFTGLLIWVPFCIWILIRERSMTTRKTYLGGMFTGAGIHGIITLISSGIL